MLITSRENAQIKLYLKLASGRKYRKERGLFVLEGIRLCLDAVKENAELHCVFVTESAEEKYGEALDLLKERAGVRFFHISDELGNKLCDTDATQGVFAICRTLDKNNFNSTICSNGKYVILNHLQDPGNVGTIIRTADAVGISGVFLCGSCDIYNPKTIRATMGSLFRVNVIDDCNFKEILACMRERNIAVYGAVVDSDAFSLTECDFSRGAAVVIGNEGNGLSSDESALCDHRLTIKMQGNINSLNAAMAAGIIMWEMLR